VSTIVIVPVFYGSLLPSGFWAEGTIGSFPASLQQKPFLFL